MNNPLNDMMVPADVGEALLCGGCLTNAKYVVALSKMMQTDWFQDQVYASIYDNTLFQIEQTAHLPTKQTVGAMLAMEYTGADLTNAIQKLDHCYSSVDKVSHEYLDAAIKNYVIQRGHYKYFTEAAKKLKDPVAIQQIGLKMSELVGITFDTDIGFDYFEDMEDHLVEIAKNFSRIATGYPCYDKNLGGGLYRDNRCLAIFMAQVHMGKSLFMGNMGTRQVKNGEFVAMLTMEMDAHVYGKRYDAMFTGMDIHNLHHNTDQLRERIIQVRNASNGGQLLIKEYGEMTLTPQMVGQYLEAVEKKFKRMPSCLYLDYLNLMIPNHGTSLRSDNSYGIIGAIARQVRGLSRTYKIPIVTATQTTRSGFGNTEIDMQHTSESIDLPAIADVMWSIYRSEDDKASGVIRTRYLKDRLGGKGGHEDIFHFNTNSMEVLEMPEAQLRNMCPANALESGLNKSLAAEANTASAFPNGDYEREVSETGKL